MSMLRNAYRALCRTAVAAALMAIAGVPARAAEPIKFLLDFTPYGKHALFYPALEKGFWRDAGFDVTILKGEGSGTTVSALAAGAVDFAFADTPTAVVGRSKGGKIKVIGVVHERSLYTIGSFEGSGIKGPHDLEGKRIASSAGDATRVLFPAFAQITGIDQAKVTWVTMTPPARAASLVAGQADAAVLFATETPTFAARAKEAGKVWTSFGYSQYGLDLYGAGLIARDEQIAGQPERVKKFVEATFKGIAWAVENPEEAQKMFLKNHPAVDPTEAREHFRIALAYLMTENTKRTGIGIMSPDKMQRTVDLVTKYFNAEGIGPNDVYTNQFLTPHVVPTEGRLN